MKAITREEKIISGENLTPITRKEMFLAKASGQNIETPTPITREEMFLSKIGGTGGGTSGATAYTVSSVDELPSNAVDGSMAIVPSDGLMGEWLFNETPNFDVLELSDNTQIIIDTLGVNDESGYFGALSISKIDGSFVISPILTNGEQYDLYFDDMWDGSSRIKCFKVGDMWARGIDGTDIDYPEIEEDVKLFFKNNAERLSGGYSLYTHENGEWVYKCEVV